METGKGRWWGNLPHALSLMRVSLVFLIYVPAYLHDKALFALLVLVAVLTDILDGPLARHLGTASKFGANVDSAADLLFYVSLPLWGYLFRPDLVTRFAWVFVVVGALYLAVNLTSHRVFGSLGVHNKLSRTSGTVGLVVTFYAILWDLTWWLVAILFLVLAADLAQRYAALVRELLKRRPARGAQR